MCRTAEGGPGNLCHLCDEHVGDGGRARSLQQGAPPSPSSFRVSFFLVLMKPWGWFDLQGSGLAGAVEEGLRRIGEGRQLGDQRRVCGMRSGGDGSRGVRAVTPSPLLRDQGLAMVRVRMVGHPRRAEGTVQIVSPPPLFSLFSLNKEKSPNGGCFRGVEG